MAQLRQFPRQHPQALQSPAKRRLWVSPRPRLDQSFETSQKRRVLLCLLLAASTWTADPTRTIRRDPDLQLLDPLLDRGQSQARSAMDQSLTAVPKRDCL